MESYEAEETENLKEYQLISFQLGKEAYAVDIEQVREVVLAENITSVPLVPTYIRGLANIRGNIITVIDLIHKLSIEDEKNIVESKEEKKFILVAESKNTIFGIWLDEMPNTLKVTEDKIDFSADLMQNKLNNQHYLKGIVKLNKEKIVILIDVIELVLNNE